MKCGCWEKSIGFYLLEIQIVGFKGLRYMVLCRNWGKKKQNNKNALVEHELLLLGEKRFRLDMGHVDYGLNWHP